MHLTADLDQRIEEGTNLLHILFDVTTGGDCGGTDTDAARCHSGFVSDDRVFVKGNVHLIAGFLELGSGELMRSHVEEKEVVVSTASDKLVTAAGKLLSECLRVSLDLLTIVLELRGRDLLKLRCDTGNLVIVRATLELREDGKVELLKETSLFACEDHASAGSSERLVGSGGHDVGIFEGVSELLSSNKTTDVGHICQEVGTNLVTDSAEALVVEVSGVC